jgi:hypothetical protein
MTGFSWKNNHLLLCFITCVLQIRAHHRYVRSWPQSKVSWFILLFLPPSRGKFVILLFTSTLFAWSGIVLPLVHGQGRKLVGKHCLVIRVGSTPRYLRWTSLLLYFRVYSYFVVRTDAFLSSILDYSRPPVGLGSLHPFCSRSLLPLLSILPPAQIITNYYL